MVDSLTLYQRTIDEGLWQENMTGMDNTACLNAMYAGAGAAYYSGSWNPPTFSADGPPEPRRAAQGDEDTDPQPADGTGPATPPVPPTPFPQHSPNKDAAPTFMQYLYSLEVYSKVMIDSSSMPATKAVAELVTDPLILTMASAA